MGRVDAHPPDMPGQFVKVDKKGLEEARQVRVRAVAWPSQVASAWHESSGCVDPWCVPAHPLSGNEGSVAGGSQEKKEAEAMFGDIKARFDFLEME